jgi:hypothetical protein
MSTDPLLDPHALLLRRQAEAAERRELALLEQNAPMSPPEARVRAWERLHQLGLPKDPAHRALEVIAEKTGLTLAQLHEVQRERSRPEG